MRKITFLNLITDHYHVDVMALEKLIQALEKNGKFRLEEKRVQPAELASVKLNDYAFLILEPEKYDLLLDLLRPEMRSWIILLGCNPCDLWAIHQHNWAGAMTFQGSKESVRGFWMVGHALAVELTATDMLPVHNLCRGFYFREGDTLLAYLDMLDSLQPHRFRFQQTVVKKLPEPKSSVVSSNAETPAATKQTDIPALETDLSRTSVEENYASIETGTTEEDPEMKRKKMDQDSRELIKAFLFSDAYMKSRDWTVYHPIKDKKKIESLFKKEIYFAYLKLRYPKNSASDFSFYQDVKIIQRLGDKPGQVDPKSIKAKDVLKLEYDSEWKIVATIDGLLTWKNGGRLMPEVVVFEQQTPKTPAADAEKRRKEWMRLFQLMSKGNSWYRVQYGQMELKNVMVSYCGINQQVLLGNTYDDLAKGWTDYLPVSDAEASKWFESWFKRVAKEKASPKPRSKKN
ncbi:MAG: hypothetical protein ACRCYO_14755 [Bacteroidia bacterium]